MSLDHILRAIKLDSGATITKIDTDGTFAGNSDSYVPTQKAVKTYITAHGVSGLVVDTDGTLTANSDANVPTQKAVKTYVDALQSLESTKDMKVFPMSFETGEVTTLRIYFPMKVTINKIRTEVTKALAATDAGTVTCGNSSGASTGGVATHAASAALADRQTATPSTNNVVLADGYYYLTTAKTTAGGKILVSLEYTHTA